MGRGAWRRVQRPRPVPAWLERGRERGDAGHGVPHAAQRRHRQICASRRALCRQAGQPDRRDIGRPALKGATNLVLGALDHREVAFHPRAFREIYKFIAGQEPSRIEIVPEAEVKLSGLVTGTPGGVQTNRPVSGATVEIYRVSAESGERIGGPIHSSQTGADGRWGPARGEPNWYLQIVLTSARTPPPHLYPPPLPPS